MTIEAQLADGRILEFPDGTDPTVIQSTVQRLIAPPPESGFIPSMKAAYQNIQGDIAAVAGRSGLTDINEAKKFIEGTKAEAERVYKPTEKGWLEAPGTKLAELAGGSLPYMAAPVLAGLAGTGIAALAPGAAAAGALGYLGTALAGATSALQFTGSNLTRVVEEGKQLEDASLTNAVLASVPQALLDTVSLRMMPGIGKMLGSAGMTVPKKTLEDLAQQGLKKVAADYTRATGKTMGVEGLTEAGQQVFERLQAGLNLTDAKAREEYFDSFIGGAALGGVLAPAGRYVDRRGEQKAFDKQEADKQAALVPPPPPPPPAGIAAVTAPGIPAPAPEIDLASFTPEEQTQIAQQAAKLVQINKFSPEDALELAAKQLTEAKQAAIGEINVSEPIPAGDGVGADVVSQPGAGIPTEGIVETQPDGLAPVEQTPAPPVGGEAAQPTALAPTEQTDFFTEPKIEEKVENVEAGITPESQASSAPITAAEQTSLFPTPEPKEQVNGPETVETQQAEPQEQAAEAAPRTYETVKAEVDAQMGEIRTLQDERLSLLSSAGRNPTTKSPNRARFDVLEKLIADKKQVIAPLLQEESKLKPPARIVDTAAPTTRELAPAIQAGKVREALQSILRHPDTHPLTKHVVERILKANLLPKVEIVSADSLGVDPDNADRYRAGEYSAERDAIRLDERNVDSPTLIHEIIHAFVHQKIVEYTHGKKADAQVKRIDDLYQYLLKNHPELAESKEYGMTDLSEFASEALSNLGFQEKLKAIPYKTGNFFTEFAKAVLKLMGISDKVTPWNALAEALISVESAMGTGRRLQESRTGMPMRVPTAPSVAATVAATPKAKEEEAFATKPDEEIAAAKEQNRKDNAVNAALKKLAKSRSAEESAKQATVLYALRNGKPLLPILKSMWKGLNVNKINILLNGATNDMVSAWGAEVGIKELTNTNDLLSKMRGSTSTFMRGAGEIVENAINAINKDPSIAQKLGDITAVTTIAQVDPSTDKSNPKLNKMWDGLGSDGQRIYNDMRDWYTGMIQFYRHILDRQVNALQGEGEAAKEGKKIILSMIKKMYETGMQIKPYFHLDRPSGEIWVQVKEKNKIEFYIYNTTAERDAVAENIAKENGKTVEEMLADSDMKIGNSLESARNADTNATLAPVLTKIFDAIDANMAGVGKINENTVNTLKDSIYQMYLASLPEESFRKAYTHRTGAAGFTTNMVENFSKSSATMSSQLSRAKYGPMLRDSIAQARGLIQTSPDKLNQEPFVITMSERVELELNPFASVSRGMTAKVEKIVDTAASAITRLSYIHYLSAAGSALVQFTGIIYGAANLGARHGYIQTAREMGKFMKAWNEFGVAKDAEGKKRLALGIVPTFSIADSKSVAMNGDEQRAIEDMLARGVSETTVTGEILKRNRVASGDTSSKASQVANTIVGGLFHASERLSREVLYLTSYRLTRKEKNADGKFKTHEQAVDQAIKDTYDSLGNMAQHNRPPLLRGAGGRVAMQFMMYPLFMTSRIVDTFTGMYRGQDKALQTQMKKEFAGIMGVTWMLAGTAGLPLINTLVGFVAAALQSLGKGDDADELKDLDFIFWFNTVFLPELFPQRIGGVAFSEIISNGPASAITGIDWQSRTSLSNMWLREQKETRTPREGLINMAVERAGPAANMILSYVDAYTAFENGDLQKGVEKMLPAIARGPVVAMKFMAEGAKGVSGEEILSKDAFSTGTLLFQSIGLRSDALANAQEVNFKVYSLDQKIKFERERILNNLKDAFIKDDITRYERFMEARDKFNARFPDEGLRITSDSIQKSIEKAMKTQAKSYKGVELTKPNIRIFSDAITPSREELERLESK